MCLPVDEGDGDANGLGSFDLEDAHNGALHSALPGLLQHREPEGLNDRSARARSREAVTVAAAAGTLEAVAATATEGPEAGAATWACYHCTWVNTASRKRCSMCRRGKRSSAALAAAAASAPDSGSVGPAESTASA